MASKCVCKCEKKCAEKCVYYDNGLCRRDDVSIKNQYLQELTRSNNNPRE